MHLYSLYLILYLTYTHFTNKIFSTSIFILLLLRKQNIHQLIKPPPHFPVNLFPIMCTAFMLHTILDRSVQRENTWEKDPTEQNRTVTPTTS